MVTRLLMPALATLLLPAVAQAGVLYSNLTGPTYTGTSGPTVASANSPVGQSPNAPSFTFMATASGVLAEVDVSVFAGLVFPFPTGTPLLVASLWTSQVGCGTGVFATSCGNPVPTVQLGSWTFLANTPTGTVTRINASGGVNLVAGTQYYFQMAALGNPGFSMANWVTNETGATGDYWDCGAADASGRCTGQTWLRAGATMPGLALLSAPVPEPASGGLFAAGLLGCLAWRRRSLRSDAQRAAAGRPHAS